MLFKSCVGLCVFTYPYAFAKVGVIWGVALSAIVCYATRYGMYIIIGVSDESEIEQVGKLRITHYRQLSYEIVNKVHGANKALWFSAFTILVNFMLLASIIITSLVDISLNIHGALGLSVFTVQICLVGFYIVVLIFSIYPQQLKIFSLISAAIATLILLRMAVDNFGIVHVTYKKTTAPYRFELANFMNTGEFLAIAGSS